MLMVYTTRVTPRVEYIFELILDNLLGIDYAITSLTEVYLKHQGPKINYSEKNISSGELFLKASDLLFRNTIEEQKFNKTNYRDYVVPFAVQGDVFPFDIFAAAFYLVNRYEEYLPFAPDKHGRFKATDSFAYQNGFLHQPVINQWAIDLKNALKTLYPDLDFKEQSYFHQPTIDVDMAYAFRNKGFFRWMGMSAKALIQGNFSRFKHIQNAVFGVNDDPFDRFQFLKELHEIHKLKPAYFFLLGDYGGFDKNNSHRNASFRNMIKIISEQAKVGIHPSYISFKKPKRIAIEKSRLERIIGGPIYISRQHYLKIKFPDTYRTLLDLEIEAEYSMGYASQLGFRASIASPFYFYDVHKEEKSSLKIYPFALMDVTLKNYLKLSAQEALIESKKIIDQVKKVNGMLVTLWHNESLSENEEWKGWLDVYEEIISYSSE